MLNERLGSLGDYPFRRLEALISDVTPAANEPPLRMTIGEPQHQPPPLLAETLEANKGLWGRYPPVLGTPDFRAATGSWLERRFKLPAGFINADRNILPVSGTREALFMTSMLSIPSKGIEGQQPAVLMPNPYYQVYAGGGVMAGAEPIYLPATRETGFLPDLDVLEPELLARTALFFMCSPANPQGAVASKAYWRRLIDMARHYGFTLACDECYSEIYTGEPPPGVLEVAAETANPKGGSLDNLIIFHSLSKRSSAPGLRCGFVTGGNEVIGAFGALRAYSVAGVPMPVQAAGAALYRDEAHVDASRILYQEKFVDAAAIFGDRFGYYTPAGGFFLWLNVGDGEAVAKYLWREAGVLSLPGGYLAKVDAAGNNPGAPYIRLALVHDRATTAAGLERVVRALERR